MYNFHKHLQFRGNPFKVRVQLIWDLQTHWPIFREAISQITYHIGPIFWQNKSIQYINTNEGIILDRKSTRLNSSHL